MTDIAVKTSLLPESDYLQFADIGKRAAANQRSQGKGPPFVRVGKKIYYPLEGICDLIAKNTVTPKSAPTLIHGRRRIHSRTSAA